MRLTPGHLQKHQYSYSYHYVIPTRILSSQFAYWGGFWISGLLHSKWSLALQANEVWIKHFFKHTDIKRILRGWLFVCVQFCRYLYTHEVPLLGVGLKGGMGNEEMEIGNGEVNEFSEKTDS